MTNDSISRRDVLAAAGAALAAGAVTNAQAQAPCNATISRTSRSQKPSKRIAARTLSPVDLTRAYLERIEQLNPRVNAYITVTADAALAQARALEAELAARQVARPAARHPDRRSKTTSTRPASARRPRARCTRSACRPTTRPCVTKLRDAGAVFLGKLNMHEFAYGGTCVITHYGPVHNPWNLDVTPGGSSGGSAAAVAARLCAGALGTDTAASIRFPAACCGVVGSQSDARAREHPRHRAAIGDARSRRAARAQRRGLRR